MSSADTAHQPETSVLTTTPTPAVTYAAQPPSVTGYPPPSTGLNAALSQPPPKPGEGYDYNHACAAHVVIVDRKHALMGPPPGATMRKKLAVCGFASSSRHLIPVNDPSWEVWGMNQLYRHIPRADRWFDIHWNWDKEVVPGTDYRGWLAGCGIPVYMIEQAPDLPTSVRYPLERLTAMAGDYFTSTVAFMTALAVDEVDRHVADAMRAFLDEHAAEHVDPMEFVMRQRELYAEHTIGLFGIDLVVEEEYFHQKACAEFWIGLAVGRGIEVYIPPQSALCKQSYRYGYEPEPQTVIRPSEVTAHHKRLTEERDRLLRELYMHDGALQADEYWQRVVELRTRGAEVRL